MLKKVICLLPVISLVLSLSVNAIAYILFSDFFGVIYPGIRSYA